MPVTTRAKAIKAIAKMTANNDHNEAYIAGCELIGSDADELKDGFKAIQRKHERLGHLSLSDSHERYELYQQMMALAKARLGDDYEAFRMSF